jgi:glutamate--cysteine ligase catalytic subunit
VHVDDSATTEHFENVQSTNWRSVRWKPPPPAAGADIGWRVELRTMEAQLTDFENAAFTVFVVLLSRVILSFDLNLYIPLSRVDANFERAATREAATKQKFFFRKHVAPLAATCSPTAAEGAAAAGAAGGGGSAGAAAADNGFEEMSLERILLGDGPSFPGLIPLIFAYLDVIECDDETRATVDK